ncbi:MAG: hypothetical protein KKC75_00395 [Nanoarchaeota archaeon]|nr:hypothetical protein [Nanoarchaeota archaeon]MBU1004977.1 hypothetical protein [Nanoarchaeota archaeon]MBU1946256.1 hypothetical protein [Nanoarchaeota archaeon]
MKNKDSINSTVVPIGEYAFSQIAKNKIYFFSKPKKMNTHIKYVFFYQVKPIQAITHYGIIEQQIEDADKRINLIEKMKTFRDPSKKASAYKFSRIEKLNSSIPFSDSTSIQGRINGNFDKIINLKNTGGLFK